MKERNSLGLLLPLLLMGATSSNFGNSGWNDAHKRQQLKELDQKRTAKHLKRKKK